MKNKIITDIKCPNCEDSGIHTRYLGMGHCELSTCKSCYFGKVIKELDIYFPESSGSMMNGQHNKQTLYVYQQVFKELSKTDIKKDIEFINVEIHKYLGTLK
jgi:adenosine deaminase